MLPKKLKLKNEKKWDLANLEFSFLILTFFGGILSLRQVCFFELSFKFLIFLYPVWPISRKINSPLRRADFKIYQHKNQKKIETPQNKEKCLF